MLFKKKKKAIDEALEARIEAEKKATKAIQTKVKLEAKATTREAQRLTDLLNANGITLKIYIATGGDRRGHARH